MAALQRFAAMLVILLAGLSLLVSTEAYQVARPVNPAQVPIVATDQSALTVKAGSLNPFSMVSTTTNGRLVLDLRKGPGGANTFGFASNSVYTLNRILIVTNNTNAAKNVSVTVSGTTVANLSNVSGFIAGGPETFQPFPVPPGQSVDINLEWRASGIAGANTGMTLTVTGN